MAKTISDAVKEYMAKQKQLNFFEDFDVDGVIVKFKRKPDCDKKDKKESKKYGR